MTVTVLPDVAQVVIDYFLGRSEVTVLCEQRIYARLPLEKEGYPALTVQQRPGPVESSWSGGGWLSAPIVQIDAWGATNDPAGASELYRTAAAVLEVCAGHVAAGGMLTGATTRTARDLSDPYFNDGDYRPRWSGDATIYVRPLGA